MLARRHMSALFLVNSFALQRLGVSLLFVLLHMHVVSDVLCFVSDMLYNCISVSRWGHARSVFSLRFRNADHEA